MALFLGVVVGDLFARLIGIDAPDALLGFPPLAVGLYLVAISPVILPGLLFICRFLTGNFLVHWLTLALLTWLIYSLAMSTSSSSADPMLALAPYMISIILFTGLLGTASAVLMFPTHYRRQARPWARS